MKKILHHIHQNNGTSKCSILFEVFKARSTGLKQKSAAWVAARQDTIGASEIAVLTGNSPFETRRSLLKKKIRPVSTYDKTACAWGTLFEPIARKYFERKHCVTVFGHSVSLDLAKDHPLYGRVRTAFTKEDEDEEFLRKTHMENAFDWAKKKIQKSQKL